MGSSARQWLSWCCCCALLTCSPAHSSSRSGLDFGPTPPARPGSSISHTRLCACTVCEPAACCAGADEDQAACDLAEVASSVEGESATVDFSAEPECGIAVRSCTGSCTRQVWRVALTEACELRQPAGCCGQP